MRKFATKYDTRCHVCGGRFPVGTLMYGAPDAKSGKWFISCSHCHTTSARHCVEQNVQSVKSTLDILREKAKWRLACG